MGIFHVPPNVKYLSPKGTHSAQGLRRVCAGGAQGVRRPWATLRSHAQALRFAQVVTCAFKIIFYPEDQLGFKKVGDAIW